MEPIAIVGMACRLPGAPSLEDFWALLRDGRHGIDLVPASRWDRERMFDPDPEKPGKINTRHGGFIEGIDLFDNDFFGISPEEATQMDPQQRIMLELTYEAFKDAGLSPVQLEGTDVGVFVGVMSNDYLRNQTANEFRHIDRHTGSGSGYCMIANRISYQFNLRGPSMAIDSACSSSLVSTFMACESLWMNQCSLALAAGVNLVLSPALSVFYAQGGLSAPDGKCRTFSDDAAGMGRGEGAGIVVLKRLSDAVQADDNIYAVIRGGSVNHNGRSNGMSAPNRWAQQQLLRKAYAHAGVAPRELQYVELHGTGTLIGDAVEATALGSVLAEDRALDQPCLVGSVKTNLGHLEGAAGIAGLIKLALCLNHGQLVPSLWFNAPNPHIAFDSLPLKVQNRLQDWPDTAQPRLGGISSFGLGGANAHLVLQSAPPAGPEPALTVGGERSVLQISARSEAALFQMAGRYGDAIKDMKAQEFSALCYTTLVRPEGHDYRATFVAHNRDEMIGLLSGLGSTTASPYVFTGRYRELPKRKRIFVFSGISPESSAVDFSAAQALAEIHPCFKQALEQCDAALREVLLHPVAPLLTQLRAHSASRDVQALPFVHFGIQIALIALWRTAGLQPDEVAGMGMGQAAAWLVSGAIDMKGAVARIANFNRLGITRAGAACLTQSGPFLINCYSPHGKNITPAPSHLLGAGEPNRNLFTMLPDLPRQKETDYFLQSLDVVQSRLIFSNDLQDSMVIAPDPQRFWLELARLSIRHNVQWESLAVPQALVRLPRYPWQHAHYWLENSRVQETPTLQAQSYDTEEAAVGDAQQCDDPHEPEAGHDLFLKSKRPGAPSNQTVSGLDRAGLLNLPESERRSALAAYLRQQVAETLHLSADELEEPQTLTGLGIDSLTAFQLKNRVESDLKVPVSLVKLLDGHSIGDLTTDLLSNGLEPNSAAGDHQLPHLVHSHLSRDQDLLPDDEVRVQIEAMSPEHIDQMLRELLTTSLHHS